MGSCLTRPSLVHRVALVAVLTSSCASPTPPQGDTTWVTSADSGFGYIDATYGRAKLRALITARSNADALAALETTAEVLFTAWRAKVVASAVVLSVAPPNVRDRTDDKFFEHRSIKISKLFEVQARLGHLVLAKLGQQGSLLLAFSH